MQTTTYAKVLARHGVEIPSHLEAQAAVPILAGAQRQGDIIVLPATPGADAGTLVPADGIAVVRGEAGGNTHLLVADGPVTWRPTATNGDPAALGTVTVPDGAAGYLLHPEHGAQGIAPGTYRIRRQREQADLERLVAD